MNDIKQVQLNPDCRFICLKCGKQDSLSINFHCKSCNGLIVCDYPNTAFSIDMRYSGIWRFHKILPILFHSFYDCAETPLIPLVEGESILYGKNEGVLPSISTKYRQCVMSVPSLIALGCKEVTLVSSELLTLDGLKRLGKRNCILEKILPQKGSDQLVTLVYTSGSTGLPKGAMITEKSWREIWSQTGFYKHNSDLPLVTLNFMPLSHMFGRMIVINSFMQGGTTYFALESDMSTIFEDFFLVRPTVLYLVPRISELIYQNFQIAVVKRLERQEAGD